MCKYSPPPELTRMDIITCMQEGLTSVGEAIGQYMPQINSSIRV